MLIIIHDYLCVDCRLVVVTLTQASLVDYSDANILHLAGFDASTPEVIRSFAIGDLDCASGG